MLETLKGQSRMDNPRYRQHWAQNTERRQTKRTKTT